MTRIHDLLLGTKAALGIPRMPLPRMQLPATHKKVTPPPEKVADKGKDQDNDDDDDDDSDEEEDDNDRVEDDSDEEEDDNDGVEDEASPHPGGNSESVFQQTQDMFSGKLYTR